MRKYRRMTYEDRCHISALLQAKNTIVEISKLTGFHKATVYRELQRNSSRYFYGAEQAMKKAAKRYRRCRRKKIITDEVKDMILAYMSFVWSPEQVSGRLRKENKIKVSRQTIYRKFYEGSVGWKLVRQRKRKRSGGRYTQRKKGERRG